MRALVLTWHRNWGDHPAAPWSTLCKWSGLKAAKYRLQKQKRSHFHERKCEPEQGHLKRKSAKMIFHQRLMSSTMNRARKLTKRVWSDGPISSKMELMLTWDRLGAGSLKWATKGGGRRLWPRKWEVAVHHGSNSAGLHRGMAKAIIIETQPDYARGWQWLEV